VLITSCASEENTKRTYGGIVQGRRGDRTSQPKRDHLMTYTKNGKKCGFRAELKSSKTDHSGCQNRFSRPGNEPAWLGTPWVLFLSPTDQICRLRYWCPVGTSCSPRRPCSIVVFAARRRIQRCNAIDSTYNTRSPAPSSIHCHIPCTNTRTHSHRTLRKL
jgi:hypothetical protein